MSIPRPCIGCGDLVATGSRCRDCRLPRTDRKPSAAKRGYPAWWRALSKAAVTTQSFCSTCLTIGEPGNPLTLDHTREAWALIQAGKRLTMKDVAAGRLSVECMRCNNRKGAARGDHVTRTD